MQAKEESLWFEARTKTVLQWYLKFNWFMMTIGFTQRNGDHCCYFKKFVNSYIILLLYADVILLAGSNMREITKLLEQIASEIFNEGSWSCEENFVAEN